MLGRTFPGVFKNLVSGDGFEVQQSTYAHRRYTDLIVVEFLLTRKTASVPLEVDISHNIGPESSDVNLRTGRSGIPNTK